MKAVGEVGDAVVVGVVVVDQDELAGMVGVVRPVFVLVLDVAAVRRGPEITARYGYGDMPSCPAAGGGDSLGGSALAGGWCPSEAPFSGAFLLGDAGSLGFSGGGGAAGQLPVTSYLCWPATIGATAAASLA